MKIDFVSDVACPWCAVGLAALERAVERVGDAVTVEWHFQPFELNPNMGPEGEDAIEHLSRKYGASAQQLAQTREVLRQRGAAEGFTFGTRQRVWNTFNAHRLLAWAATQGRAHELKRALLQAYHGAGENPGATDVLLRLAAEVGLDPSRAADILAGQEFTAEVRQQEQHFQSLGIRSVPAVIINDRHLIQGGQASEVFEQALRQLAAAAQGAGG